MHYFNLFECFNYSNNKNEIKYRSECNLDLSSVIQTIKFKTYLLFLMKQWVNVTEAVDDYTK